jgi:aquaporin Z
MLQTTLIIRNHWPEYLMEAALLALFMISASTFGVLLGHPSSPVLIIVPDPIVRQILMGLAMGATAIGLILSPMGKRSGAHMNPATSLTFLRLGKMSPMDAAGYITGQFAGGVSGMALMSNLLTGWIDHPLVNFVATQPGAWGTAAAWTAELLISFGMMTMVLNTSNHKKLSRFTPYFAGLLVAAYIAIEAPVSGMSMNPARTFGSALAAHLWNALWIYFTAPPLGMLLAAELYVRRRGIHNVFCAKFHHHNSARCIFNCNFGSLR